VTVESAQPLRLWSRRFDDGGSESWSFLGDDGLDRLSGPATYVASDPSSFRARLVQVQLDHVVLEAFAATPHTAIRAEEHIAASPTALLMFMLLAEGRMTIDSGDRSFELQAGQFIVADSRHPLRYSADSDIRLLRTMVGADHVPTALQRRGTVVAEALDRTPLAEGFAALISSLLRTAAEGRLTPSAHMIKAVAELQSAVLAEAQDTADRPISNSLRDRIEDYIDAHLADPDLGPAAIAEALGISLRHAHGTFGHDGMTIGRFIRERRIESVAIELRGADRMPDPADLAARHGFRSVEALNRAFRAERGASVREYQRGGHRETDDATSR
jgi:AraC-like DNA-binding protein